MPASVIVYPNVLPWQNPYLIGGSREKGIMLYRG